MKVDFNLHNYNRSFCSNTEPGSVDYNHPTFLEKERESAKARIAKYIEESETKDVLNPKSKSILNKLEDIVKSKIKKIKK